MGWGALDFFLRAVVSKAEPPPKPEPVVEAHVGGFMISAQPIWAKPAKLLPLFGSPRKRWSRSQRRAWAFEQRLAEAKQMDQQFEKQKRGL